MTRNNLILLGIIFCLCASNTFVMYLHYDLKMHNDDIVDSQSMSKKEEFSFSHTYMDIVNKADKGDINSIDKLINYYHNGPNSDMRNLRYWSKKGFDKYGAVAYSSLIIILSERKECNEAWMIIENNFKNPDDFEFYQKNGQTESIDGRCVREHKS